VRLTRDQVNENLKTFKEQIGKILNFEDTDNPIEFRFNSEWLAKMNFEDLIGLASYFTVQQMIERDIFEKRLKSNKPLYIHEFFYPLMQGYDSVALEADLEIGGTDQTFNMFAGRTLVKAIQKKDKYVMSTTLLVNPVTGEKLMSKSLGTGIGLNESSRDMYGKTMALPDEAIIQCFVDCTYLDMNQIKEYQKQMVDGVNPRDIKSKLAHEIVRIYHGEAEADRVANEFVAQFKEGGIPDEITEVELEGNFNPVLLLTNLGAISSNSEGRRLVEQGGLKIDDAKITDPNSTIAVCSGMIIQLGKLRYWRIK